MKSIQLLAAAILACASLGVAEDEYLVRVATVGFVHRLDLEIEPDDEELSSIETVVRPGVPFHAKVEFGSIEKPAGRTAMTLKGQLSRDKDGRLSLEVTSLKTIDTGSRIPIGGGKEQAMLDQDGAATTIRVTLGESVLIGGWEVTGSSRRVVWLAESGEEWLAPVAGATRTEVVVSRQIKRLHMLRVTKYQPEQD